MNFCISIQWRLSILSSQPQSRQFFWREYRHCTAPHWSNRPFILFQKILEISWSFIPSPSGPLAPCRWFPPFPFFLYQTHEPFLHRWRWWPIHACQWCNFTRRKRCSTPSYPSHWTVGFLCVSNIYQEERRSLTSSVVRTSHTWSSLLNCLVVRTGRLHSLPFFISKISHILSSYRIS